MRSIWEGSISFGLINIPVRLYSASRERKLSFHFLHKADLCPIKYVKVCKTSGEEVPFEEIVRGFEYAKGQYIVLEDKDFEKADVKKTHMIDVFQFVDSEEIDSIYFEKPYYLEPQKTAQKAYVLLREVLKKTNKVGIAKFVLRTREYLGAVRARGDIIVLDQMRFGDEIVDAKELNVPDVNIIEKKELEIATKLVAQLSDKLKLENYRDTYTEALEKIIAVKAKGKIPKAQGEMPVPITEMEDILDKLKESLKYAQKHK